MEAKTWRANSFAFRNGPGRTVYNRITIASKVRCHVERPVKRFLFAPNCFLDSLLFRADFGENIAHRFRDDVDQFEEERFVKSEGAAVANRAAQDATQNVTASFV